MDYPVLLVQVLLKTCQNRVVYLVLFMPIMPMIDLIETITDILCLTFFNSFPAGAVINLQEETFCRERIVHC